MRIDVKSKVLPTSFLKIEERGRSLSWGSRQRGTITRIGKWSDPRFWSTSQKQKRAREEGAKEIQERNNCRKQDKKNRNVKIIKEKEAGGDNPIEYFLPTKAWSVFWAPKGWWKLKSLRMNRFLKERSRVGEKESISAKEERIGGV